MITLLWLEEQAKKLAAEQDEARVRAGSAEQKYLAAKQAYEKALGEYKEAVNSIECIHGCLAGIQDEILCLKNRETKPKEAGMPIMHLCSVCKEPAFTGKTVDIVRLDGEVEQEIEGKLEDGAGQCKHCDGYFCAEHNELKSGVCPSCLEDPAYIPF